MTGPITALVINRAADTARMALMHGQLDRLGLSYERLEARTPDTLSPPADDRFWQRWERPMTPVEMAIAESHMTAWRRVEAADRPLLILEDDALLAPGAPDVLAAVAPAMDVDHLTLEVRGRRKLVARTAHPAFPGRRMYQDRTGAAAYVLWPQGARVLLARSARGPGLADAMICAAYDLRSYQADPALAIQVDQCDRYGVVPPPGIASSNASVAGDTRRAVPRSAGHRFRRAAAQLRMGLRLITKLAGAERRLIDLAPDLRSPT